MLIIIDHPHPVPLPRPHPWPRPHYVFAPLEVVFHKVDVEIAGQRATRRDYRWSAWGENVAAGAPDAASVVTGWMNSPEHRANVLNPSYTDIGVGLAYSSNGTPYWTMVLARPG